MLIQRLESWYLKHHRDLPFRSQPNPYWIWISEIMLQQTQMDTVIPYFLRFVKKFPTLVSLAKASEEDVLTSVQGLGYYRRFRLMKKAASIIMEKHQGLFPNRMEDIEQLPGVGPYTAGAIASIAFGLPVSAVDGNVLRVIARYQGIQDDISLPATRKKIAALNQQWIEQAHPPIYTQALMELGALVCRPVQPRCQECPLKTKCVAFTRNLTNQLPLVAKKKRQAVEKMTTLILIHQGKLGLEKQKAGLLEGMYGFPQWHHSSIEKIIADLHLHPDQVKKLGVMTHVFTHKRWEMTIYFVKLEQAITMELRWVSFDDVHNIPMAKAHRKLIETYKLVEM